VVFEVTDEFQLAIKAPLAENERAAKRGIFFVKSDGSGLRRISRDATRVPPYQVDLRPPCCRSTTSPQLPFSRDGRTVLLTDLGPGPANEEPVQIFTLDVITGARTQVTNLPKASSRDPLLASTGYPDFIPGGRILFYSYANPDGLNPAGNFTAFTVRRDGSDSGPFLRCLASANTRWWRAFGPSSTSSGEVELWRAWKLPDSRSVLPAIRAPRSPRSFSSRARISSNSARSSVRTLRPRS
jgi:hypothetical protein